MYEPTNTTARPIDGTASAAFSCAISPANDLMDIEWYFNPVPFSSDSGSGSGAGSGSGMGLKPGPQSGMLYNDMEVGVTIHQPADPGTSILILDSVSDDFEGFYYCVAVFRNDNRMSSSEAALIYNRMFFFNQYFLLKLTLRGRARGGTS